MTNTESHAARLARFSAATATITMPAAPADRSRNAQRPPRRTRRRFIR